jgi:hypothetical protein
MLKEDNWLFDTRIYLVIFNSKNIKDIFIFSSNGMALVVESSVLYDLLEAHIVIWWEFLLFAEKTSTKSLGVTL